MLQMHAVMSEWERDQISARTKAALAAAKARGVVLGATGSANTKKVTLKPVSERLTALQRECARLLRV